MTQQVESQCDQHDAVKSALQIPLPLSHKKHPLWIIQYFDYFISKGRYHLCGLSAKMTNQFFWTKKGLKMDLWGKQMGKNVVYWPKTPDFCPLKWQNSKLNSIGPMSVFCNRYWRKNTFFQVRLQLLLPCGPLWVWGTSASTYGWGRQRRYELLNYLVIKDLNNFPPPVFLLDEPEKIPRHNLYELVWFLKTGATRSPSSSPPSSSWLLSTRMKRMMLGLEPFVYDFGILTEGYQHYTPWVLWGGGGELQRANGHL